MEGEHSRRRERERERGEEKDEVSKGMAELNQQQQVCALYSILL